MPLWKGTRLFTTDMCHLKGYTPIRLKEASQTRFLELSRWFSTHIRHMRDLKLSSLRRGIMSIDWYKLVCLQEPLLKYEYEVQVEVDPSDWTGLDF